MTGSGRMGAKVRGVHRGLTYASVFAAALATGCHHRRAPVLLPPQTPVALIEVPVPQTEPLVEVQSPKLPAVPTAQAAKPVRVKKRSQKRTPASGSPSTTATVAGPAKNSGEVASATAGAAAAATVAVPVSAPKVDPPVVGIGALTVGGEQSPHAMQEASELAASNERRLNALSPDAVKAQAELIGKVRNFQKEAQQALGTGDAEGAKTLATKGKLLLDDLDKGGSQ